MSVHKAAKVIDDRGEQRARQYGATGWLRLTSATMHFPGTYFNRDSATNPRSDATG